MWDQTIDLPSLLRRLERPEGPVDVVLDTDTANEIDDQFALSYLLASSDKLHTKAIYAAPFFNDNSSSPQDGMEKSYQEILRLLELAHCTQYRQVVFKGATGYLPDENTPVSSPASQDLAQRAMEYSPEHPLYVVAIGAITDVASALLLLNPSPPGSWWFGWEGTLGTGPTMRNSTPGRMWRQTGWSSAAAPLWFSFPAKELFPPSTLPVPNWNST